MKTPRKYASAVAFRVALEDRLKRLVQDENIELQRVRRQAAFDRLLYRIFASPDAPWLLKGGYAMELRLKMARATRDIDLALKRLPVSKADWDANVAVQMEFCEGSSREPRVHRKPGAAANLIEQIVRKRNQCHTQFQWNKVGMLKIRHTTPKPARC